MRMVNGQVDQNIRKNGS